MSAREDLAEMVRATGNVSPSNKYRHSGEIADAVIAAGYVKLPIREALAAHIRCVDGNHTMGAAALADEILAFLAEDVSS